MQLAVVVLFQNDQHYREQRATLCVTLHTSVQRTFAHRELFVVYCRSTFTTRW